MSWKSLLEQWNKNIHFNEENPLVVDHLLKFETTAPILSRSSSPIIDANMSPVIGIQIGLIKEYEHSILNANTENELNEQQQQLKVINSVPEEEQIRKSPLPTDLNEMPMVNTSKQTDILYEPKKSYTSISNQQATNYISEEIQLKAVYELQMWKEAREKEFEQEVIIIHFLILINLLNLIIFLS
jgi:hypothetical protein